MFKRDDIEVKEEEGNTKIKVYIKQIYVMFELSRHNINNEIY